MLFKTKRLIVSLAAVAIVGSLSASDSHAGIFDDIGKVLTAPLRAGAAPFTAPFNPVQQAKNAFPLPIIPATPARRSDVRGLRIPLSAGQRGNRAFSKRMLDALKRRRGRNARKRYEQALKRRERAARERFKQIHRHKELLQQRLDRSRNLRDWVARERSLFGGNPLPIEPVTPGVFVPGRRFVYSIYVKRKYYRPVRIANPWRLVYRTTSARKAKTLVGKLRSRGYYTRVTKKLRVRHLIAR